MKGRDNFVCLVYAITIWMDEYEQAMIKWIKIKQNLSKPYMLYNLIGSTKCIRPIASFAATIYNTK